MKRFIKTMVALVLILSLMPCTEVAAAVKYSTTVEGLDEDSTSKAIKLYVNKVGRAEISETIPGLKQAVTCNKKNGEITYCPSMTPQGMTVDGNYILISAYCKCDGHPHNSVIYIIDKSTREYKSTLVLDTKCHVGGIAVCGNYIWVCDSGEEDNPKRCLLAYRYSDIKIALKGNCKKAYSVANRQIDVIPSYMCSVGGDLYVGTFSKDSSTSEVHFYTPQGTNLNKQGYITISGLKKIQGISISGNYMVVTSSYGVDKESDVYVYRDSASRFGKSEKIYNSPIKKFKFPNMVEGCYIDSDVTYFVFESAANYYLNKESDGVKRPLDQYLGFKNSTLGIKSY